MLQALARDEEKKSLRPTPRYRTHVESDSGHANAYLLQRRGRDSNPRWTVRPTTVFETAPFNRSGTPPRTVKGSQTSGALIVRDVTAEDWPAIWSFMSPIVKAADTFPYDPAMTEAEAKAIWLVDRTVVAVEPGGRVVGTANMYANRPGPGSHVASGSFMVDPAHWGKGVGRVLCEEGLDWAKRQGYRAMQFNAVAESNTRAIALYESLGFETIGTVPEAFEHPTLGYVGLCVMYRRL
jgi:RimJ/RimL family protein N-acetyltransferase